MLLVIGSVLVGAATFASNTAVERFLLGDASGQLAWGPTLFRALLAFHGGVVAGFGLYRGFSRRPPRGGEATCGSARRPQGATLQRRPDADRGGGRQVESTPPWTWATLAGLSIVALGLRLPGLNGCLWLDEILTLVGVVRRPLGEIVTMFPSQNQHMFYSVLAHASVATFGESAAALRLPAVGLGVACIWALFLLGRRTVGTSQALLTCALMTVSYHHVWFSQNARGYIGLLFFTLLATWLWLEAVDRGTVRWWICYAVSVALGAWMHMTMVFVAAAHFVVFAVLVIRSTGSPPRLKPWGTQFVRRGGRMLPLAAWGLSATLTLQLHALALPEFLESALHEVSLPSEWTNPLWVVEESLRVLTRPSLAGKVAVFAGGSLLLVGWVNVFVHRRRDAFVMLLPGVLAGGTMVALGHNLWPRFFFFCMGFAVLFAISGVVGLPRLLRMGAISASCTNRVASRLGLGLASLMILASASTLPRCYALPKQDFLGARDFIRHMRMKDDGVVAVGLAGKAYGMYYARDWAVVQTRAELDDFRASCPRSWLVYTLPIEVRAYHPQVWEDIVSDYEVVKIFPGTLGDGDVTVCLERR